MKTSYSDPNPPQPPNPNPNPNSNPNPNPDPVDDRSLPVRTAVVPALLLCVKAKPHDSLIAFLTFNTASLGLRKVRLGFN